MEGGQENVEVTCATTRGDLILVESSRKCGQCRMWGIGDMQMRKKKKGIKHQKPRKQERRGMHAKGIQKGRNENPMSP